MSPFASRVHIFVQLLYSSPMFPYVSTRMYLIWFPNLNCEMQTYYEYIYEYKIRMLGILLQCLVHGKSVFIVGMCPVLSCPVLSCPALPCPVLSCPALPCPVPSRPVPSRPVPSRPVPSRPVPSFPVLSCSVLPCPVLSCPVLLTIK